MKTISGILLASTMLVGPAIAQAQQSPNQTQGAQRQQQQQTRSGTAISAQEFAREAGFANLIEIQTSQLALRRSDNEDVRAFAKQMVTDHQNALRRLRTVARDQNVPTSLQGEYSRFLQDMRETNDFDREYVDAQINAHQETIDLFENYAQGGQHQGLRQFAQQTLPTLRRHLQMAENLTLDDSPQAQAQARGQNDRRGMQNANQQQTNRTASNQQQVNRTATARVLVQQQAPEVTVDQAQPRIIVRQPPPTITLQQAQPEIIVRMPPPDVNVSTQRPQVSLRMTRPTVSVNREGRQRVYINRADQPQVTFERTGEPRIQVREAQGQPRIRYEQVERSGDQQNTRLNQVEQRNAQRTQAAVDEDNQTTGSLAGQQARTAQTTPMQNNRLWISEAQRLSASDETAPAMGRSQVFIAGNLMNENVYNGLGQELGTIERVIEDATSDRQFVVLSSGGFLGLFEDTTALPVERLRYENGRFVIRGLTEQDIEAMPNWENTSGGYRDLPDNDQLELTTSA